MMTKIPMMVGVAGILTLKTETSRPPEAWLRALTRMTLWLDCILCIQPGATGFVSVGLNSCLTARAV